MESWQVTLRDLAHERNTDLRAAVGKNHPYAECDLQMMLAGRIEPAYAPMIALLDVISPVSGPNALQDRTFRTEAFKKISGLPQENTKNIPSTRKKEIRDAKLAEWCALPTNKHETFGQVLKNVLQVQARSVQELAEALKMDHRTLYSNMSRDHMTKPFEPLAKVLEEWGTDSALIERVSQSYVRSAYAHKYSRPYYTPQVQPVQASAIAYETPVQETIALQKRCQYQARVHSPAFAQCLKEMIATLGLSPYEFDKRVEQECGITLQTALWCQSGAQLPKEPFHLLHGMKHLGIGEESRQRLVAHYIVAMEEARNIANGSHER